MGLVRGPKITVPDIPSAFKTIGLIFYGRRSRVEILNCYLKVRFESQFTNYIFRSLTRNAQRNLVENGGSLDEVHFVVKTNDVKDLQWLDKLILTSKSYVRVDLPNTNVNFGQVWDIFERGIMYVKIDDDVVWMNSLYRVCSVQER